MPKTMRDALFEIRDRLERALQESVAEVAEAIAGKRPTRAVRWNAPLCLVAILRDELRRRQRIRRDDRSAMNTSALMIFVAAWTSQRGLWELADLLHGEKCGDHRAQRPSRVQDAIRALCRAGTSARAAIDELHRRGAFRYEFDVVYAVLAQRRGRSVDEIQGEIDTEYAQTERRHDPVYPPS